MKYLFFDTETTGFAKDKADNYKNFEAFPRIVEIAWILFDGKKEISCGESIIKPVGFTIPTEASNVHGISTARALKEGKKCQDVLLDFYTDFAQCDTIVAHNADYDRPLTAAEYCRHGWSSNGELIYNKPYICTMKTTTNICKIPKAGRGFGYKWPKLQELHKFLFGKEFEDAHSALADIRATADCFWELVNRGIITAE